MGVTRLKRKDRKNKARANNKVARIKQLLATPVIKNVDVEELKARFGQSEKTAAPAAENAPKVDRTPAPEQAAAPQPTPAADQAPASPEITAAADAGADTAGGDVESPGERFLRNQLADTTSSPSQKDIDAINMVEEDEADTAPEA
jgi:hypothetical protein